MKSLILCVMMAVLLVFVSSAKPAENEGLVLYLSFEEGEGDVAKDTSGKGNNGTINGAEWVINGRVGSALSFGSGDYVEVPHDESLSITDEITIMAWTNMAVGSSGEMAIVSKGQWAANDLPYEVTETAGGVIYWQFYNDAGRDSCAPNSPPTDEWHHIAATYDGEIFKAYIDGQLAAEWQYAGKMPENAASVTIGKRSKSGDCFFTGMIDEVVIFSRALDVEEIQGSMEGIKLSVKPVGKLAAAWGAVKN